MSERRPVFHGLLGVELRELREANGWSQSQTVDMARRRKLPQLSLNQLRYLEEGRTKHPEAETLRAVCALYSLNYDDLVDRFVRANYGFDAVRTKRDAPTVPLTGLWKLVGAGELELLAAWRVATDEGRRGALAVLKVQKKSRWVPRPCHRRENR